MFEKDPVCGMYVDGKRVAGEVAYKGQTYYFCGPGCKAAFEKEPEKYVNKPGSLATERQGHMHH